MEKNKLTTGGFTISSFTWALLLALIFSTCCFAEPSKIDSLNRQLDNSRNDSVTFDIYLNLGLQWEAQNFDSALFYYSKAITFSEKNSWHEKKAKALIYIGFAYYYALNSEESLHYLQQGLDIFLETSNKKAQLDAYYNLGVFHAHFEDYIKAIENFNRAVALGLELKNELRLGMTYNNLGLMYHYTGNYDKANLYQFKALDIKEKTGDNTIDITYLNIGLNYLQQQNLEKSLEYYNYALDLFIQNNKDPLIAQCHKNIGDVFLEKDDLEAATESFQKAFSIFKTLNDQASIASYHMVMGMIYQKQNLFIKAEDAYQTALNLFPESGSRRLLFYIKKYYAELYIELASASSVKKLRYLNRAISFGKEMSEIAENSGSIALQTESYNLLYSAYKATGNNQKAVEFADKFILSKDSLFSEQKQKTIINIQTKYETEKKELEIELLNSENELITTSLSQSIAIRKNQLTIIYILIAAFAIVIILILMIYRFYSQAKIANTRLSEKNKIISRQKGEIELLLKEVHHRVKNNLQIITSLLDLQLMNIDNPETKATLLDAQSRLKSISLIHEVLSRNEKDAYVSFKDFVTQLAGHIKFSVRGEKQITIDFNFPDKYQFNIKTTIPLGLIINELLTNAFKYAFSASESGKIRINMSSNNNNQFILEVWDNGSGLPDGFDIEASTSLGLSLILTLCEQLSGKLKYKFDGGAKFSLLFLEAEM